MTPITAVLITKNEQDKLPQTLQSILGLVDEILIYDSGSTDQTKAIAQAVPNVRWVEGEWLGFGATKNLANSMAKYDWILSLDADEPLSLELKQELLDWKKRGLPAGSVFRLNRLTHYCGAWVYHSGWSPDWHIRLFPKAKAEWTLDHVHEKLQVDAKLKVISLQGRLHHYSFDSLSDHLQRIDRYSEAGAKDVLARGKRVYLHDAVIRGIIRFVRQYVFERGFLDGWRGFAISSLSGFAVYMKYLKAYAQKTR